VRIATRKKLASTAMKKGTEHRDKKKQQKKTTIRCNEKNRLLFFVPQTYHKYGT